MSKSRISLSTQLDLREIAMENFLNGLGLPPGADCPTNWEAYRSWVVSDLGILKIGSKSSTNIKQQAQNEVVSDYLERAKTLLRRALALKKTRTRLKAPSTSDKLIKDENALNLTLRQRDHLISVNQLQLAEIKRLQEKLASTTRQLATATHRNDELNRHLNSQSKRLVLVEPSADESN